MTRCALAVATLALLATLGRSDGQLPPVRVVNVAAVRVSVVEHAYPAPAQHSPSRLTVIAVQLVASEPLRLRGVNVSFAWDGQREPFAWRGGMPGAALALPHPLPDAVTLACDDGVTAAVSAAEWEDAGTAALLHASVSSMPPPRSRAGVDSSVGPWPLSAVFVWPRQLRGGSDCTVKVGGGAVRLVGFDLRPREALTLPVTLPRDMHARPAVAIVVPGARQPLSAMWSHVAPPTAAAGVAAGVIVHAHSTSTPTLGVPFFPAALLEEADGAAAGGAHLRRSPSSAARLTQRHTRSARDDGRVLLETGHAHGGVGASEHAAPSTPAVMRLLAATDALSALLSLADGAACGAWRAERVVAGDSGRLHADVTEGPAAGVELGRSGDFLDAAAPGLRAAPAEEARGVGSTWRHAAADHQLLEVQHGARVRKAGGRFELHAARRAHAAPSASTTDATERHPGPAAPADARGEKRALHAAAPHSTSQHAKWSSVVAASQHAVAVALASRARFRVHPVESPPTQLAGEDAGGDDHALPPMQPPRTVLLQAGSSGVHGSRSGAVTATTAAANARAAEAASALRFAVEHSPWECEHDEYASAPHALPTSDTHCPPAQQRVVHALAHLASDLAVAGRGEGEGEGERAAVLLEAGFTSASAAEAVAAASATSAGAAYLAARIPGMKQVLGPIVGKAMAPVTSQVRTGKALWRVGRGGMLRPVARIHRHVCSSRPLSPLKWMTVWAAVAARVCRRRCRVTCRVA
jgi:hypothetical protein